MANRQIFAIDGDGVIFNYDKGYIDMWERAFGWRPELVNPHAILVVQKYGVPTLNEKELKHFRSFFDEKFWETLEFLPGAEEACKMLSERFELHCVTALDHEMGPARKRNLGSLPFESVITTPIATDFYDRLTHPSPKAQVINKLNAFAFADDYLPFHRGINDSVFRGLIAPHAHTPEYQSSFNANDVKDQVDGVFDSLLEMAEKAVTM